MTMNSYRHTHGYLSVENDVIPCDPDDHRWLKLMKDPRRFVGKTKVGDAEVSTVFLCINHGRGECDLWFETMLFDFGSPDDCWMRRYETWDEASAGHERAVACLREGGDLESLP